MLSFTDYCCCRCVPLLKNFPVYRAFFLFVYFFERTRRAASMRPPWLVMRQGRESEATEPVFCLYAKKPLHTGVRSECRYLRSHAGHFFLCVFVDYSNKILYKNVFFSISYTTSGIYTLMVGKQAVRKTAYLPNRTCVGASLTCVCWCKLNTLDQSLHSPQSFCTCARSVRCVLQPEKRLRKER